MAAKICMECNSFYPLQFNYNNIDDEKCRFICKHCVQIRINKRNKFTFNKSRSNCLNKNWANWKIDDDEDIDFI